MAKLTAAKRKKIPKSEFGVPSKAPGSGSYPMPDAAHARNALARVSQHGTPTEKAKVRAKAKREYPSVVQTSVRKKGGGFGTRTYKR